MKQRDHKLAAIRGGPSSRGGLSALFPLAMVFTAIAFLAVGANRAGPERTKPQARAETTAQSPAQPNAQSAASVTAAEEAAAAAVVAISLARVAPPRPEEVQDKPQAAGAGAPDRQARQDHAAPRDAQPNRRRQAAQPPNDAAPMQIGATHDADVPAREKAKPRNDGVLSRIGGAVTQSVAKLASYIPGL